MARCNSCSAPLPANTNKCLYCGIRNDVDLTGKHDYSIYNEASDRICPHCDKPLQTIALDLEEDLLALANIYNDPIASIERADGSR